MYLKEGEGTGPDSMIAVRDKKKRQWIFREVKV